MISGLGALPTVSILPAYGFLDRSFVCWHVLAILYRSERMYIDAAKALAHAYAYQPVRSISLSLSLHVNAR